MNRSQIVILTIIFLLITPIVSARVLAPDETIDVYGQYFFHNDSAGRTVPLTQNLWSIVDAFAFVDNGTQLSGFDQNVPNNLTATINGVYKVEYSMTFTGQANNKYHIAIFINDTFKLETEAHSRVGGGNDIQSVAGSGIINLTIGDNVSLRMFNEDSDADALIFSTNFNLHLLQLNDTIERRSSQMIVPIYIMVVVLAIFFMLLSFETRKRDKEIVLMYHLLSAILYFIAAFTSYSLREFEGAVTYTLQYTYLGYLWVGVAVMMLLYTFMIPVDILAGD